MTFIEQALDESKGARTAFGHQLVKIGVGIGITSVLAYLVPLLITTYGITFAVAASWLVHDVQIQAIVVALGIAALILYKRDLIVLQALSDILLNIAEDAEDKGLAAMEHHALSTRIKRRYLWSFLALTVVGYLVLLLNISIRIDGKFYEQAMVFLVSTIVFAVVAIIVVSKGTCAYQDASKL